MNLIADYSQALIDAHRTGCRIDTALWHSPDYAQALEIQQRVQSALGAVGGFKVARRAEGLPAIAPIISSQIVPSGSDVQVRDMMGIELEIGFELTSDAVATLLEDPSSHFCPRLVLELVDTRLKGATDEPIMKLADMQINSGLVVGPALEAWDGADFQAVDALLKCGDRRVFEREAIVPGGSALDMLAHFLDHVGNHCGGLRKGHIVITGSLSGLLYFPAGTAIAGSVSGFGEVSCRLV
jgi:2-keto-4-pentenoate hydratase